ncbi:hypothetical protein [Bacillus sp. 1P06AnD]|uniref:hypothetical protein n=1 Tax=Bacillus sp. 1P06AnD TaxID=3132208 RepID=UPI0039A2E2B2
MKSAIGMNVPKRIEVLTKDRLTIVNEPYYFKIQCAIGDEEIKSKSAHVAFDRLKEWAETEGAHITLIKDRYVEQCVDTGYILIEISDPVALVLGVLIEQNNPIINH